MNVLLPDDYTIEVADNSDELSGLGGTTPGGVYGEYDVTISGSDYAGVDFGYNRRGAIGDTVFSDSNGNGIQDPGDGRVLEPRERLGPYAVDSHEVSRITKG